MPLSQPVYSVLLVSSSAAVNDALGQLLPPSVFSPVRRVGNVSAAARAFAERAYDIVIVNSPLPEDPGVRFAVDAALGSAAAVLLLVRAELYDDVTDRVSPHGVFTLQKPCSGPMLQTALRWLMSARARLKGAERKTLTLEEKMAEIRLVNRAKWVLIEARGMDEPAAHRYIEKQAMDRCVTRRVVAQEILDGEA